MRTSKPRIDQTMREGIRASLADPRLDVSDEEVFGRLRAALQQKYAEGIASGEGRDITPEALLADFKSKITQCG